MAASPEIDSGRPKAPRACGARRTAILAIYSHCIYISSFMHNIENCPKIDYLIGQI
jgi:hypothetical protein